MFPMSQADKRSGALPKKKKKKKMVVEKKKKQAVRSYLTMIDGSLWCKEGIIRYLEQFQMVLFRKELS